VTTLAGTADVGATPQTIGALATWDEIIVA